MTINGEKKEIYLSWYELINKMHHNPPKKIELMTTNLPIEQRKCTWDENNLVYKQDYNNSVVYIPLGLNIYIETVIVMVDDCNLLESLSEIGE